jgi:hypothetical protein
MPGCGPRLSRARGLLQRDLLVVGRDGTTALRLPSGKHGLPRNVPDGHELRVSLPIRRTAAPVVTNARGAPAARPSRASPDSACPTTSTATASIRSAPSASAIHRRVSVLPVRLPTERCAGPATPAPQRRPVRPAPASPAKPSSATRPANARPTATAIPRRATVSTTRSTTGRRATRATVARANPGRAFPIPAPVIPAHATRASMPPARVTTRARAAAPVAIHA